MSQEKPAFSKISGTDDLFDTSMPPLFNTRIRNGEYVKEYNFIRGSSGYSEIVKGLFVKDVSKFQKLGIADLKATKSEIEDKMNLNRQACIGQYNHILLIIGDWIKQRQLTPMSDAWRDEYISKLFFPLSTLYYWIVLGVEADSLKRELKQHLECDLKYEIEGFGYNLNELIDQELNKPLACIQDIVTQSAIIYYDYLVIQELMDPKPGSNNDKLKVAKFWMDPLMKKITSASMDGGHKNIENIFREAYEGFKIEYQDKAKFAAGELKKEPIGRALKFIYEKEYLGSTITTDTIIGHYRKEGYW